MVATFKTQLSAVSGTKYYRLDDFVSVNHAPAQYMFRVT